jgi:hypothetical protein
MASVLKRKVKPILHFKIAEGLMPKLQEILGNSCRQNEIISHNQVVSIARIERNSIEVNKFFYKSRHARVKYVLAFYPEIDLRFSKPLAVWGKECPARSCQF